MSFFTSFSELLDFDHSTNLNGFHFSNSLFGFDSNSIPTLENLPPPDPPTTAPPVAAAATTNTRASLTTPLPILEPTPLPDTPKQCQTIQSVQPHQQQQQQQQQLSPAQNHQQTSPIPIISKFQLKVTPNNEIYISNESGTFCELAGSFVPSPVEQEVIQPPSIAEPIIPPASPEPFNQPVIATEPEPPITLFCIEKGVKRPLSPSDRRYCNSGIFRSSQTDSSSPLKKKTTSTVSNGTSSVPENAQPAAAKLVVSNVINNGLIVNKKHLSTSEEPPKTPLVPSPERRIMRPKKRKRKAAPPKITLEAKPVNGRIVARVLPEPIIRTVVPAASSRKIIQQESAMRRTNNNQDTLRTGLTRIPTVTSSAVSESTLNFSGIKEKAAQEAIFSTRVEKQPSPQVLQQHQQQQQQPHQQQQQQQQQHPPQQAQQPQMKAVQISNNCMPVIENSAEVAPVRASLVPEESCSNPAPVELKVVADLVMDKNVFGHISLLNNSHNRGKTVIYQNPVTSTNVIYSILNPKTLNLSLGGVDRGTTATLTLEPHRGGRRPKKRGRKKKVLPENGGTAAEGTNGITPLVNQCDPKVLDPDVPVMITRSGRLSKPPRYANNYFQNIKQKTEHSPPPPPPPPPPPVSRLEIPAPDPETAEKLPNFSAAFTSTVLPEPEMKRKMTVPLQYRCATCNKIYLGRRMQRHLEKYPSHNTERDCVGASREKKSDQDDKSIYLYKHLFDLLQKFTEKDKGRVMLKEISNFVDFVRALIPRLITNDEQNSTVEYIDHNVADVLRLNHGKYRLKLSSLAEEYEKLNLTVNLLNNNTNGLPTHNGSVAPITSTPNGTTDRQSLAFNADDLLNQSSSFPSLTTLVNEHNLLVHPNSNNNNIINSSHNQYNNHHMPQHHHNNSHFNHHHHLPLVGTSCHDDAMNSLSGLCKSPVQHSASGMVNMALNLY